MSGCWYPGDLALCVHGPKWVPGGCVKRHPDQCSPIKTALAPQPGSVWTVDTVGIVPANHELNGERVDLVYLALCGQPSDISFDARHFRKIEKHQADQEDIVTIDLMTGAPVLA